MSHGIILAFRKNTSMAHKINIYVADIHRFRYSRNFSQIIITNHENFLAVEIYKSTGELLQKAPEKAFYQGK
jgi:hypothetical protein